MGTVVVLLGGCVVQSIHPFCTEASKIDTPEAILGRWQPVKLVDELEEEDRQKMKPWVFTKGTLTTTDTRGVSSPLRTVFFRIGGELYCDFTAVDPDQLEVKANEYWHYVVTPVHALCKVTLAGDRLTFTPMDYSWFEQARKDGKQTVPFILRGDDFMTFTATPKQWEAFLKRHGKDPKLFSEADNFIFTKLKPPEGAGAAKP